MASGKSVQLYLVDGTPGGLMIAEIVNWTGKILSCPRSKLESLLKRPEVEGTGVYILLGDDPDNPLQPLAYIGETDEVKKRLIQHNRSTEFWNRVVAITNKDLNMTKAHVRYLEHQMISRTRAAKRSKVQNANDAVMSPLPEAAQSDMEQFLEQVELILPLLNVNILRKPQTVTTPSASQTVDPGITETPTLFEYHNPRRGLKARAQEVDGEFVVLEGSEAAIGFSQPDHSYYHLRMDLESDGTLVPTANREILAFSRDYVFSSPSAAGAVVNGGVTNGRRSWRVIGTGQTYDAWHESKIRSEVGTQDE